MIILLEAFEFIRALGFPGANVILLLTALVTLRLVMSLRAGVLFWGTLIYVTAIPLVYSVFSARMELAITAFSIFLFFTLIRIDRLSRLVPLTVRAGMFLSLVLLSYFLSFGNPVYIGSKFNSPFFSANAFVYYLLLNACTVAFVRRQAILAFLFAIPLALIQTKSVAILAFSSRATLLICTALIYPLIIYIASFDRISWFLDQYGVIYALGAGRIERFTERATSAITLDKILVGSPFPNEPENFEIEFIDFVRDFGLFYTIIFFVACAALLKQQTGRHFSKIFMLFLLLNLAGHFWNNPILIISFAGLVHHVNRDNN